MTGGKDRNKEMYGQESNKRKAVSGGGMSAENPVTLVITKRDFQCLDDCDDAVHEVLTDTERVELIFKKEMLQKVRKAFAPEYWPGMSIEETSTAGGIVLTLRHNRGHEEAA
jgi:hypothetical protein